MRAAFLVRRERWTLTWLARILILVGVVAVAVGAGRGLCEFLSVNTPIGGEFLVVEGWMPSYAYREAANLFHQGGYRKIIAAGVAHDDKDPDDAPPDFGVGELVKFGVPRELITAATAPEVQQDRTFHSALAVKRLLLEQGSRNASIDVLTIGPHGRRSRLLFQAALGDAVQVGMISVEDRHFDPKHWWRSSEGVRTVIAESIAYLYARFLFLPTS